MVPPVAASASTDTGVISSPPKNDMWIEGPNTWIRMHVEPRSHYCHPQDYTNGPTPEEITEVRESQMIFQGTGRTKTHVDKWTDKHSARKGTRSKWTGKTVFFKKSAKGAADAAEVPRDGVHIQPGTTEQLRTGLAAMRTELAAA